MNISRRQSGFSLVELLIVVAIIGIIAAIAIPSLLASRRAANEASAISSVRTLSNAQESYRATSNSDSQQYATLAELVGGKLVDSSLGTATTAATAKSGYFYAITLPADRLTYCVGAAPVSSTVGARNFSTDTTVVIYTHPLDVSNPPTSIAGGTPVR